MSWPGVLHSSHLGEQDHERYARHSEPDEMYPLAEFKQPCQALAKTVNADR